VQHIAYSLEIDSNQPTKQYNVQYITLLFLVPEEIWRILEKQLAIDLSSVSRQTVQKFISGIFSGPKERPHYIIGL